MNTVVNEDEVIGVLRKISFALKSNDESTIGSIIDQVGVDLIFSKTSIELSRALRDVRLTVFLLLISKENNLPGENNEHWMTIYNSINTGVYPPIKLNYQTGFILKSILEKNNSAVEAINNKRPAGFNMLDLELAIDFRKWSFVLAVLHELPAHGNGLHKWLVFLKMIVKRQKFINNSMDGEGFARVYKLIIQKLNHIDAFKASLNVVRLLLANSLKKTGEFHSALLIYEQINDSNNSLTIMMEKAHCQSKMGNFPKAIEQLDSLLCELMKVYSGGNELPMLLHTPADLNFTKTNAIKAYSDLVSLAEISDAKLFLVSGTLLGYCRISDFLPNDKDLDFGLIGLNKLPALVDLAIKSGLFQINSEYFKDADTIQVPFIHVPTGVWIDVFIYHDLGEKFMTGVDFQFGYRQTFQFSKFDLGKVKFHNLDTYIPLNFDENLKENFMDWKVPDVNYISHVESPSVMDYGGVSHQMTLRFWLIRSIQSKSIEKFDKVSKVLKNTSNYPMGISLEMLNYIEKYRAADQCS